MADEITTRLKSLQKYMDVRQGKIVKLEMVISPSYAYQVQLSMSKVSQ